MSGPAQNRRKMRMWTKFHNNTIVKEKKAEVKDLLQRINTLVDEISSGGAYDDVEVFDRVAEDGVTIETYRSDTGDRIGVRRGTPEERTLAIPGTVS